MTDQPSEQEEWINNSIPTVDLEYPRLQLEQSFTSLLSHSYATAIMSEQADGSSLGSLSESWTALSNSAYSTDDDRRSESTDIGSLIDNSGPEDVHSIDEGDDLSEAGGQDFISHSSSQELRTQRASMDQTAILRSYNAATSAELPIKVIQFEEPHTWPDTSHINVKRTIDILNEFIPANLTRHGQAEDPDGQFLGTVRMTMAKSSLDHDKIFRLLYVGNPKARDRIKRKIDHARATEAGHHAGHVKSGSSSLSSSDSTNAAQIQAQTVVDECLIAERSSLQPNEIFLGLRNGSACLSRRGHAAYEISSISRFSTPDLTVFFISEEDDLVFKRHQQLAHEFIARHCIPYVVVCDRISWHAHFDTLPVNAYSPHLCLEKRPAGSGNSTILQRHPIDLVTFELLSSRQLNRNLSYLSKMERPGAKMVVDLSSRPLDGSRQTQPRKIREAFKSLSRSVATQDRAFLKPAFLIIVASLLFALLGKSVNKAITMLPYLAGSATPTAVAPLRSAHVIQPVSPNVASSVSTHQSVPSITAQVPATDAFTKSLATRKTHSELAELRWTPWLDMINGSDKFQVQVRANSMIIIPPDSLIARKTMPRFSVEVQRGDEMLNATLQPLFDRVYSVKIDPKEAYGPLNVTITMNKSSYQEEHEVIFPRSWSKGLNWHKAAQDVLTWARDGFNVTWPRAKQLSKEGWQLSEDTIKDAKVKLQQAEVDFNAIFALTTERMRNITGMTLSRIRWRANIWQEAAQDGLSELQIRLHQLTRSGNLAKAQERAQQLAKASSHRLKQHQHNSRRRTPRRQCGRKGKGSIW